VDDSGEVEEINYKLYFEIDDVLDEGSVDCFFVSDNSTIDVGN
jgi:hypothetical protein